MQISLNTHFYDGKLGHWKEKLEKDKEKHAWLASHLLPFSDALKESKQFLISRLEQKKGDTAQALKALDLLGSLGSNADPTSDLTVSDVFPIIWAAIRSLEERMTSEEAEITRSLFVEQVGDIMAGSCIQGQIYRLLMCYGLIESVL